MPFSCLECSSISLKPYQVFEVQAKCHLLQEILCSPPLHHTQPIATIPFSELLTYFLQYPFHTQHVLTKHKKEKRKVYLVTSQRLYTLVLPHPFGYCLSQTNGTLGYFCYRLERVCPPGAGRAKCQTLGIAMEKYFIKNGTIQENRKLMLQKPEIPMACRLQITQGKITRHLGLGVLSCAGS